MARSILLCDQFEHIGLPSLANHVTTTPCAIDEPFHVDVARHPAGKTLESQSLFNLGVVLNVCGNGDLCLDSCSFGQNILMNLDLHDFVPESCGNFFERLLLGLPGLESANRRPLRWSSAGSHTDRRSR